MREGRADRLSVSFARRVTHPGPVVRYRDPTVVADRLGKVQAGKRGNLIM